MPALGARAGWLAQWLPLALLVLAAGVALTMILRATPGWTIDVGAPGDTRFITDVLKPEIDRDTGVTFRWTKPRTTLRLHGTAGVPVALSLRLHNSQPTEQGIRHVRLFYGDRQLPALTLAPGWRIYTVLLPAAPVDANLAPPPLTLESDVLPGSAADGSERGVPLDQFRVDTPLSGAAPWYALVLTWGLAALAGWLWRLDRALLTRRERWRWLRAGLPVGAAALGLVWWAATDPATLAWALPALPRTLAVVTAALLVLWLRPLLRPGRLPAAISIAMLIAAQAILNAQTAIALGVVLAALALVLLPLPEQLPAADQKQTAPISPRTEALLLGLLFVVALGLRFYRIADLPYGLWRDEARHGLAALHILEDPSYRPAYIPEGVDLPGLGMYPFALAIELLGVHVWSMRVVTALAGALTVFPIYGLARRLFGRGAIPLGAAALLAVSSWHLTISRFSFPTIFDPLLQLTALWLLLIGLVGAGRAAIRHGALLLAGICLGLAAQTYHTGRIGPVVAGVLGLLLLLRMPRRWPPWLAGVAVVGVGFLLAAAPLIRYALDNSSLFNERVGTVFVLGEDVIDARPPLAVLEQAVGRNALMFNVLGDQNGRHHAPDRAMLDFITGLGLLAGLAALLHTWRDWRAKFVLAALLIGMAPGILSSDSPHAMRGIDALPFACIIAAIGLATLWRIAAPLLSGYARAEGTGAVARAGSVAGLVFGLALALNAWTYFVAMPANDQVWRSFYPVHTRVGAFLRDLADQRGPGALEQMYVPATLTTNAVFAYLTHGLPVRAYDSASATAAPPGSRFLMSGFFYPQDVDSLVRAERVDAAPDLFGPDLPDGKTPSFVVFRKP
jgi:4-amino-4-deoxy-L-arabinose transferase-like glycosyltransferase